MNDQQQRIHAFIVGHLQPKLDALEIPSESIEEDFDLVGSGVLDSMAFIEFVGAVEAEFQVEIDFADIDPSEFTIMNRFIQCVADSADSHE